MLKIFRISSMLRTLIPYKWYIIQGLLAFLVAILGFWGYLLFEGNSISDSVFYATRLLMLELDIADDQAINWQIEVARVLAIIFVVVLLIRTILLFMDEKVFQPIRIKRKKNHMIVCGLSGISIPYLRSEDDNNVVIIEPDENNRYIQEFINLDMEVFIREYDSAMLIETLSIENAKHILIVAGDDMYNINLATTFIEYGFKHADKFLEENKQVSMIIHIVNRELYKLFEKTIIPSFDAKYSSKKDMCIKNIFDIRMVSYYQETAKELLFDYPIDRSNLNVLRIGTQISLALVGFTEIGISIVEEILKQSHYPEANKIVLWIISDDKLIAKEIIGRHFFDWEKGLQFQFEYVQSDRRHKSFYDLEIWKDKTLTNIYLANENEADNLKIAMNLDEFIYNDYPAKPNILYYLKNQKHFASHIDGNKQNYSTFNSFGKINTILCEDNLIHQRHEDIAKVIHKDLNGFGTLDLNGLCSLDLIDLDNKMIRNNIDRFWRDSDTTDREYSRSQASHMDVKLRYLGLKRYRNENNSYDAKALMKHNERLFDNLFKETIGTTHFNLVKKNCLDLGVLMRSKDVNKVLSFVKSLPFYNEITNNIFDKLTIAEHRRLNMYHLINGWEHHIENKKCMAHNCLNELIDLPDDEKATIYYDWLSILNIPKYCSAAGYILNEIHTTTNGLEDLQ